MIETLLISVIITLSVIFTGIVITLVIMERKISGLKNELQALKTAQKS